MSPKELEARERLSNQDTPAITPGDPSGALPEPAPTPQAMTAEQLNDFYYYLTQQQEAQQK